MKKYYVPDSFGNPMLYTYEELQEAYARDDETVGHRSESDWKDNEFESWFAAGMYFGWVEEVEGTEEELATKQKELLDEYYRLL